ncbi:hypothetical protein GOBAR_AA22495 [Gossypium barbadense]|uniref:C2 tensin-type domain-containing protein n=1 Tax=Gossypium barbadense TaxID=3634 RepID=A0A2P5X4B7_GOSBA|nr:hypothetical protein GOBAR_AA22495 [Gossypium barbadense]
MVPTSLKGDIIASLLLVSCKVEALIEFTMPFQRTPYFKDKLTKCVLWWQIVFDCCFTIDAWEEENYTVHVNGIVNNLHGHFPDASFLVFNFREGESKSYMAELLSEYDMTIMDYPCQYEGCPLIAMEGGWPVLAFMLAALLIYRKQYSGEQKTLDMIYKQAPSERLQLLSSLNPVPSQLRYLQYVSRRNVAAAWPPLDRALTLDCVILRQIPNVDGEGGCRPVFRIYGQDPFLVADKVPKLLYSTPKRSKYVRYYKQKECALVKIDINCHVQGDIVVECINLSEKEREKMIFRVVFNSAFIRSNILMLNRDEIDVLWDAKDQFPKEFRAEIIFSEMDAAASITSMDNFCFEEKEGLPIEAFAKVQEMFSNVDWLDPSERNSSVDSPRFGRLSPRKLSDEKKLSSLPGSPRSPTTMGLKTLVSAPSEKSSLDSEAREEAEPQDSQIAPSSQPDAPQSAEIAKNQPSEVSTSMSSPASAATSTVTAPLALAGKEDQVIPTAKSPLSKTSPAKEDPEVRVISPATSPPPTPHVQENQTISDIPTEASASLEESLAQRATTPAARTPSPASPLSKTEVGKDGPPAVPPPAPVIAESPVAAPSPPQQEASPAASSLVPPTPPPPPPTPTDVSSANPAAPPLSPSPSPSTGSSSAPPPPPPPPTTGSSSAPPPPPPPLTTGSSSAPPPPPAPFGKKTGGGPSAPAPPPLLSSANSKNRLLSRSSNSKNDKKLKPLHWLKLSRAVQGSLWAEAQKTGEASKTPEIDISELENLFSAAAPNTDRGNKQGSRTAKGPKTEIVQLIDHRRAYNCEIMLSKVKVPLPELMDTKGTAVILV